MSEYGITDTGFKRKRLDVLLEELNAEVKSIFGDNFNVSPESPDGQVNGVVSESNANLWEIAEEAYNAFNPSAVTKVTQDNLYQLNGITRLPATASTAQLTLSGSENTTIPEGSLVSTSDTGVQFSTDSEAIITSGGSVVVSASATVTGPISALANTITVIDNPITGWDSVTNSSDALEGTDLESDADFRARRQRSVARDAQAIVDAIFAAVRNIPGVTQTAVLENDTNETDENGQPPHSVHVIAVGGDDEEIAKAIFLKKTLGATPFGNVDVSVSDDQGIEHVISFSRPEEVPIYVRVDITAFEDFPADGSDQIRQAIVDYANGDLVGGRGFSLAEDVIYTRLYTPINSVQGHEVDTLRIGTSPSPTGTSNIEIGVTETSVFTVDNIAVNVL